MNDIIIKTNKMKINDDEIKNVATEISSNAEILLTELRHLEIHFKKQITSRRIFTRYGVFISDEQMGLQDLQRVILMTKLTLKASTKLRNLMTKKTGKNLNWFAKRSQAGYIRTINLETRVARMDLGIVSGKIPEIAKMEDYRKACQRLGKMCKLALSL